MPTQTIRGALLSHTEQGRGTPLVLLHAFPVDSRIWAAQQAALSDQFRVVLPEVRGFGQSKDAQPFSLESLADDVHAQLAAIGALPCVLGGLSMGGYISLAFAEKFPNDLRGLILADTKAAADTPDAKAGREKMIELARTKGAVAVADAMLPKMLAPATANRPDRVQILRDMMTAVPPLTIEHALAAMRDRPDRTSLLGRMKVPVLILVGESDQLTPPDVAETMQKALPNATRVVIKDAGHLSPFEQPDEVNAAIRSFLARV